MSEMVDVMLRDNFQNVSEDRLGQIDRGGIFYINSQKKIFEKVNPEFLSYTFLKGLYAHDNLGNNYVFFGDCNDEKVRCLYKDNVAINSRIEELTRN